MNTQMLILGSVMALLVAAAIAAIVSKVMRNRREDEALRMKREEELRTNPRPNAPAMFSGLRPSGNPPVSRAAAPDRNSVQPAKSGGSHHDVTTPAVVGIAAAADAGGGGDSGSCGGGGGD